MLDKLKAQWLAKFSEPKGDFDDGATINASSSKLNRAITTTVLCLLVAVALVSWMWMQPVSANVNEAPTSEVAFGQVVDDTFTEKDNQSALSQQQLQIESMNQSVSTLQDEMSSLAKDIQRGFETLKNEQASAPNPEMAALKRQWEAQVQEVEALKQSLQSQLTQQNTVLNTVNGRGERLGDYDRRLPPVAKGRYLTQNPEVGGLKYQRDEQAAVSPTDFDISTFEWDAALQEAKAKRTIDNYVPTGTFVTAVVTGGADANAGVSGQGDTAPIVFQTVNSGILPNGEHSKLDNCSITGSVYGEISSSRGIVRTARLSCIQDNGDILDIPVQGTAFNFGRNGIRGTTILKNGDIVEMAGISGILTGIGETGKALSQTTTPTALGPSQTIQSSDALINLLGNATSSVGSKLADYYIKLAELYHPIVEINPGGVVNIVFLKGFPLDPLLADEYEAEVNAEEEAKRSPTNGFMSVLGNVAPISASGAANPLAQKMVQEGLGGSSFGQAQ
ncbi:TrbI/VirB10 family protein [Vibrio pectenicida]|uniref:TrbI/VirB10 family protein n=1 Tax=Vibrio pectenicida TaxID=62763 RepID=UPI003B9DB9B9